ncbi:hypothetical protein ACSBR2_034608 [Camellia fascicularis]
MENPKHQRWIAKGNSTAGCALVEMDVECGGVVDRMKRKKEEREGVDYQRGTGSEFKECTHQGAGS